MIKGNSLQLFYHTGSRYSTLAHSTANSLQVSNETQTVSSKDMGLHPLVETTGSNWSCSGSMLFTTDNAAKVMGMAASG